MEAKFWRMTDLVRILESKKQPRTTTTKFTMLTFYKLHKLARGDEEYRSVFRGADLSNLVLSCSFDSMDLSGSCFDLCDLTCTSLANGDFTGADFSNCNLRGVNFSLAILRYAILPIDLSGLCFAGADFSDSDLRRYIIRNVDFTNAKMKNVRFPESMTAVVFLGTDLENVDFRDCKLTECEFTGANLSGTKFPEILPDGVTIIAEEYYSLLSSGKHAITLRAWIDSIFSNSVLTLLWKGLCDGFSPNEFHKRCDDKSPTLTLFRVNQYIFGGYSTDPWSSPIIWMGKPNLNGFIFTLSNPHNIPPTRYFRTESTYGTWSYIYSSLSFGDLSQQDETNVVCKLGDYYEDTTGKGETTFTGFGSSQISDVEVYEIKSKFL